MLYKYYPTAALGDEENEADQRLSDLPRDSAVLSTAPPSAGEENISIFS